MPKDRSEGKAEVRIFYAEVKGGDSTIKDGLNSLANAFVRAMLPPPPRLPRTLPPALSNGGKAEASLFDSAPEDQESEDIEIEAEDVPAAEGNGRGGKPSRQRKAPSYVIVKDLNLRPADKPSLKDLFGEKKPGDQQEQIAVFVYYLSRVLQIDQITDDHIYTCFKDVGKRVPQDILQVARNTAARKGWVDSSTKNLTLTVPGENYVEHELPKNKSDAT